MSRSIESLKDKYCGSPRQVGTAPLSPPGAQALSKFSGWLWAPHHFIVHVSLPLPHHSALSLRDPWIFLGQRLVHNKSLSRLVQDGRVEGRVLCSSSVRAPKSQLAIWTIIYRRTLEHTKKKKKKRYPTSKDKEKLQQAGRRGAITIKSNLIPLG